MKKIAIILITFINSIFAQNIEFFNQSFDCKDVKKDSVEYKICTNQDLSKLDKDLNEIYKKLLILIHPKEELIEEQIGFIKQRNSLSDVYSIKNAYKVRIDVLENTHKFANINIDDYKEKKFDYINISGDTSRNNSQSKLLVNLILEKIDIFDKEYYKLLKNGILFETYGSYLEDGLYYASKKTGNIIKLIGGNIDKIIFLKSSDTPKIAFKTSSLRHSGGYEGLHIINIKDDDYSNKDIKTLIEYSFYGESYYCGFENIENVSQEAIDTYKLSGHVEDYEYDGESNILNFRVIEQNCINLEYKEKNIAYDIEKDIITTKNETKLIYDEKKDIFINAKDIR